MDRSTLAAWARRRIAEAHREFPALVTSSGDAFMLWGTIGSCGYVTIDGEVYLEEDTMDPTPGTFIVRRDERARRQVLFFAARRYPELWACLPSRSPADPECDACAGAGWRSIGEHLLFCDVCDGRGWVDVSLSGGAA